MIYLANGKRALIELLNICKNYLNNFGNSDESHKLIAFGEWDNTYNSITKKYKEKLINLVYKSTQQNLSSHQFLQRGCHN